MPESPVENTTEDPSPLSSSSNTTLVTGNRGLVEEYRDLPENTKPPILETVDARGRVKMDSRSVDHPHARQDLGTQIVDGKRSESVSHSIPQRISVSPQSRPPVVSQHRRTHSEDFPFHSHEFHQPTYSAFQFHQPPPLHATPSPPVYPSPRAPQGTPRSHRTPQGFSQAPSHHRSRSWNANVVQGMSAAGNPLIPILQDKSDTRESFAREAPSPSQGRRKRSFPDQSGRVGLTSVSGAPTFYGRAADVPPPPPPGPAPVQQPRIRAENWSPRAEIMSLTKGFTSRRPSPPHSPSKAGANHYRTMSPRISPSNQRMPFEQLTRHESLRFKYSANPNPLLDHSFSASMSSIRGIPAWQEFDSTRMPTETDALLGSLETANRSSRSLYGSGKMQTRQQNSLLLLENIKGIPQPAKCRDAFFVLLFVIHLFGILYLGSSYGSESLERHQAVTLKYRNAVYMACFCGAFAVVVSTITLLVMMTITKKIIQLALFLTIALSFAWGTIGIGVSPKNFVPITGIIALALTVGYAFVVWDRIPFAASNLHAGLRAVRANMGLVLVAFVCQGIALGWTIYYTFVVIGIYDALDVGDLELPHNMEVLLYVLLGLSFYWTFHILMNIVQVTVAGTIGSWWFKPDDLESSLWNHSTGHALFSAVGYSIGSICFGSLLIGPVRLIRQLSVFVRPTQEDSMLLCLHEFVKCVQMCISSCVDKLSDRFNPWALTYVGLYGYGLIDAGLNATELFEKRGWTTIVSDDLVANVLLMFSVVVGGVTGCFGMLIQGLGEVEVSSLHEESFTAFVIGVGIGLVLTSVLFALISSSVNAVLVCYAESPLEFEHNHPELSGEMRASWLEVWPGYMEAGDFRGPVVTGVSVPII